MLATTAYRRKSWEVLWGAFYRCDPRTVENHQDVRLDVESEIARMRPGWGDRVADAVEMVLFEGHTVDAARTKCRVGPAGVKRALEALAETLK